MATACLLQERSRGALSGVLVAAQLGLGGWAALGMGGCAAGSTDSGGGADCSAADSEVTWENWGEGFFTNYCRSCHSVNTTERLGAPEGVDFDTEADVLRFAGSIRVTVLENGTMPVGGGLPDEEMLLLDTFLRCGL